MFELSIPAKLRLMCKLSFITVYTAGTRREFHFTVSSVFFQLHMETDFGTVDNFTYLGSSINKYNNISLDILSKIPTDTSVVKKKLDSTKNNSGYANLPSVGWNWPDHYIFSIFTSKKFTFNRAVDF